MIRSAASRAPALANAELCAGSHQRRFKTFVRRVDKNQEVYYTLARKGLSPDPNSPVQYDFFEMPDLLLDLDAEGTRNVRSFEDDDERHMKGKWAVVPKRTAVRARLKQFEEQVYESRRRAHEILSQPTNIWRITSHDIVSAALRGASVESQATQASNETPGLQKEPDIFEKLRIENGIPPHATEEDEQLLRWMILRRKSLEQSRQKREEAAPTPLQLAEALEQQMSITGVRRLVFQCLAAGTSIASFKSPSGFKPGLPLTIREACERVLRQYPGDRTSILETLIFIGNLSERLSRLNTSAGAALCGLGLKLSSGTGLLETTSEWLYRGYDTNSWSNDVKASKDVLSTLSSLRSTLSNEQEPRLHQVHSRQLLFQLLTGIDENDAISPDSFRALATLHLNDDSHIPAQQAFEIYESYILLLGQLGATRMLWKEWRLSAPQARKRLNDRIVAIFGKAVRESAHVIAASNGETRSDLNLDECATRDYHAIEMQAASTLRHAAGAPKEDLEIGDVASALDLPLEGWMKQVARLQERRASTYE
ncbi:hypothetical protein TOPH_00568 [Tolypocladium ophioglossoides CBS 100239]|uniref:Uncharacterized protein n=1 Tax=Tolypocladium ophioglossoides (strain CBS 100239) TaxID=1163406 RepID=A0A0L0NLZ0_TOLOC|nr:hypothetical protein TOPH_00568 [Tolypocladium ophioglossoides CBS 100239]